MLDPLEYEGVAALVVEKGNEVIENVFDAFASGIRSKALYLGIGSGVALLGVIVWNQISPRLRRDTRTD